MIAVHTLVCAPSFVRGRGCLGLYVRGPGSPLPNPSSLPYLHSPTGTPGAGESIICVLFSGIPELLQRVLSEDAYGQGQLGAVCGDQ